MAARRKPQLSLAEHCCLALVVEGLEHGWAIGTELAPGGTLGTIWSLSRPLTYRAIESLAEAGLIERSVERGTSRERALLAPTDTGRRVNSTWLETPVEHLRDLRTELLLKLTFRQRAGLAPESLLDAQEALLGPVLDSLIRRDTSNDLVALWRQENARAARRFLRQARATVQTDSQSPPSRRPEARRSEVRLSARNQLRVTIDTIAHGDVMTSVKAVLPDGQRLTAAITSDAVEELDLASGDEVVMIVKSTEIMVAKPE